jgi:YjbE family integral membrane protein
MFLLADAQFWQGLGKIVGSDIILAGDNAVVIALAVRSLPGQQQFWGRIFGSLGAVGLRVLFVWLITWLLNVPFLKFVGGILLIWIAFKLLKQNADESDEEHVKEGNSFWHAIWIIVVADIVMSFDNVVAIAGAAHGHMGLVIFGLVFSIPLVIFGSGILSDLMKRFPALVWLGAGLLGHVAGDMILSDERVGGALGQSVALLEHRLPILLGAFIVGLGWWFSRKALPGTPAVADRQESAKAAADPSK